MSIDSLRTVVETCYGSGQYWHSSYRKVPPAVSLQNTWVDLSMAPGNPRPNYYTGTELTSTAFNGDFGIYHYGNVSPATKHLHKFVVMAPNAGVVPAVFRLCDYLFYYPLIDMDSTDEQEFTTTLSLPRYADGVGVQMILVATNPYVGGAQFTVNYTNSDGVAGRTTRPCISNAASYIGTLVSSGAAAQSQSAFLPLACDDKGVRSVQSITFYGPNGGLAALALVRPLATLSGREILSASEFDFINCKPSLPRIYDGAYLGLLCAPNGSMAAQVITGDMSIIWN